MSEEQTTTTSRERAGDCKERVAYDLMRLIAKFDTSAPEEVKRDPKSFWLELYRECREAVDGNGTAKPLGKKRK